MAQRMTKEWLRKRCKELDLYTTPSLNEKLYLNFQGFSEIENLEEYTGLKSIFLEGNCLDSLKVLQKCKDLKCLFSAELYSGDLPPRRTGRALPPERVVKSFD